MNLTACSLRRPLTVLVLVVAVTLGAWLAVQQMKLTLEALCGKTFEATVARFAHGICDGRFVTQL